MMAQKSTPNGWRFWTLTLNRRKQKTCPKRIEFGWVYQHLYTADMFFVIYKYLLIIDLTFCIEISKLVRKQKSHGIVNILSKLYRCFGSHHDLRYWAFHISVVDGFGFGRDSTFLSASFQPDVEKPWDFYQDRDLDWDFLAERGMLSWPSPKTNRKCPWTWIETGRIVFQRIPFSVPNCWG